MIQPFFFFFGQDSRLFVLNPLNPVSPGPGVAVDDLQKQTEIFFSELSLKYDQNTMRSAVMCFSSFFFSLPPHSRGDTKGNSRGAMEHFNPIKLLQDQKNNDHSLGFCVFYDALHTQTKGQAVFFTSITRLK